MEVQRAEFGKVRKNRAPSTESRSTNRASQGRKRKVGHLAEKAEEQDHEGVTGSAFWRARLMFPPSLWRKALSP